MKTTITTLVCVLALAACGDDVTKSGPADAKINPIDAGPPAAPKVGAQLDRMGRPAVSTALNHTFNETDKQTAKDAYNHADDPTMWAATKLVGTTTVLAEFEKNLAIIDSLDSTAVASGCSSAQPHSNATENLSRQPLYNDAGTGADAYKGLAGALADDELFVNTASGTCTQYLAVEGQVIAHLSGLDVALTDCGGRAPSYDVIDVSYTALAKGLLPALNKQFVTDGAITADDAPKSNDKDFPFLGAPH